MTDPAANRSTQLAGGVVITSLRAELPDERRGRFWPFCFAAVAFSALLMFA
jgi:hypothetical protein